MLRILEMYIISSNIPQVFWRMETGQCCFIVPQLYFFGACGNLDGLKHALHFSVVTILANYAAFYRVLLEIQHVPHLG